MGINRPTSCFLTIRFRLGPKVETLEQGQAYKVAEPPNASDSFDNLSTSLSPNCSYRYCEWIQSTSAMYSFVLLHLSPINLQSDLVPSIDYCCR